MTLFSKLRELEKKATPGEWETEYDSTYPDDVRMVGIHSAGKAKYDKIIETDHGLYPPQQPDADLIVEMRNALPKIFEVLDLYEEALEHVDREGWLHLAGEHLVRQTLKRAKEIAGE